MVFYRERENERPPLSLILPRLYLGAESDVTQDSLGARGISYVLSVSRCSPQPTFLPRSQYLRIPIDDSLRDDLLPWIPEALHFIDGAMSSGGSVLVHCAAGISRSPALAVAYIMYSLGMDLDHAYRFVKERRPSISPNFNFLGQLQHFQGTLSQKASDGSPVTQPLQSFKDHLHSTVPLAVNHQMDFQGNGVAGESAQVEPTHAGNSNNTDKANSKYSRSGESGKASNSPGNAEQVQRKNPSALTLSLSGKLRTLHLTLNENQREARMCCEPPNPSQGEPAEPVPKPNQLQLPVGHSSLLEKRKSLTLSLSPVGAIPTHNPHPTSPKTETGEGSGDHQTACSSSSKTVHKREMGAERQARRRGGEPAEGALPGLRLEENQREWSSQRAKYARATHDPPRARVEGQREGRAPGVKAAAGKKSEAQMLQKAGREASRGRAAGWRRAVVDQQPSAEAKTVTSSFSFSSRQPEETSMTEEQQQQQQQQQGPLSPLNLTLNKLLGWGEKMLLGVLLGPRIKMGQAALPYRC